MKYKGVIIEESLMDTSVLNMVQILSTKIEQVTEKHKTPWLAKWTLHSVEINPAKAEEVAILLGKSLEKEHPWYADFDNEKDHYIIFRDKIFHAKMNEEDEYNKAKEYGISLGIPEYQVDFHPKVGKWDR